MPHTSAHRDGLDPGQLLSVRSLPDVRTGHVVVEVTGEVDTYTAPLLDACLRSQAGRRVADDRDGIQGRPGQVPDHRRSLTDLRLNRWGRP